MVTSVADVLSHDATDTEIATFAERNGWVVLTNDDDFYDVAADVVETVPDGWG